MVKIIFTVALSLSTPSSHCIETNTSALVFILSTFIWKGLPHGISIVVGWMSVIASVGVTGYVFILLLSGVFTSMCSNLYSFTFYNLEYCLIL